MGQKSSKAQQGAISPITLKFDGGLNYSQAASQIADNELTRALNMIYNNQTGTPETRNGTECVTPVALDKPIRKLYYYEKSATDKWLIGVAGAKLYYLNVDTWAEIDTDAIANETVIPQFITFNTKLIIADGSTNLRTWDGTTFSTLSDNLSATAIKEINARVVINSATDPDLVTFSGVEDETMWNTADLTNPAVGLRAGFGDNMLVNSFAIFGSDLIVSKKGDAEKRLYRINTSGVPTGWTVSLISANNCALNEQAMVSAFNNVFFVDNNGFKTIKGVTEYGDLQIDLTGAKINSIAAIETFQEAVYIPAYTAIWLLYSDNIYAYHVLIDRGRQAFTTIKFQQGKINTMVQAGSDIYLGAENGCLYKINSSLETDEVSDGVTESYPTVLVSKRFNFFGGGILRRVTLELKAVSDVSSGTIYLRGNTAELDGTVLKTISIKTGAEELFSATYDLNDANTLLYDMSNLSWVETSKNRIRGTSVQFQIDSFAGKWGIESLLAEVALVEG